MKKLALAVAMATFSLAGAASAADMPVKAPIMKAPITVSNDWTGFYVGGNIGYMRAKTTGNFAPLNPAIPWDAPYNSALGGAQAGFNWQFNQFVIGVEGSLDGAFADFGSTVANGAAGPCGFIAAVQSCLAKINDVASVGARLGWTPWSQWLLFAQGGWAGAHISTEGVINGSNVTFGPASNWHNGWFVGGGIDYAITSIVSVGVDYKHYEFNSADHTAATANNSRVIEAKADAVFARVNVKLWGPNGIVH